MNAFKKFSLRSGMLLTLTIFAATSTYAQRAAENDEDEAAISQDISEQNARILSEAIEFLNMEQYAEARARLGDMRIDRLSPFEKSRLHQLLFNLEINDEDYPGAREQLQLAIDSGGLNIQEISTLKFQMAQLFVQEEKYPEAAAALEAWIAAEPMPNSQAYYLLAASYYYQELFDKALPNAQKAVDLSDPPLEGWLTMLASLLIEKEDHAGALPVVKRLVNMFPDKKTYWQQLSGLYLLLEDYENALIVLEFLNYGGMVTEDREIRQLADLYMMQEMPIRAALLLESAIAEEKVEKDQKAYESLANSWIASREFEKAVPVLGEAADLSDDGAMYQRMGEVLQQLEEWEGSADAFKNALDKGGLRDAPYIQYLLGYSLFQAEEFNEAKDWLNRAARDSGQRENANNLIKVIDSRSN